MKKMPLLEIDTVRCRILEDKIDEKTGLSTITAEVKWQQADAINTNKRRYPRGILEREIARLRPKVLEGEIFGAAYHPEKAAEIPDVASIWRDISINENGECVGVVEVLPTTFGRDVQVIMRANGKIGLSSRGSGTFSPKTERSPDGSSVSFNEINEDYHLVVPGDFVLTPSVIGAGIKRIIEARYEETDAPNSTDKDKEVNEEELKKKVGELEAALAEANAKIATLEQASADKDKAMADKVKEAETATARAEEATKAGAKVVEFLRSTIMGATEIPGVIPDPVKAGEAVATEGADTAKELEQLKAENARLTGEIAAKTKAEEDKKAAEEAAAAKADLQAKIKEAFDSTVGKADYKPFETIVRKELIGEGGSILIESVELVEDRVKAVVAKAREIIVEAERAKIVATIGEKGTVGNPDKPSLEEQKLQESKNRAGYQEALSTGYRGTFEQWLKVTKK